MDARIIEVPQNVEELRAAELEKLDEDELEAYLLKIEEQMQKREAHIKKLREDSEKQDERKVFLEARAKQIDAEILVRETQAASYDEKTQQLEKKINENGVKISSLDKRKKELDKKLEGLQQERLDIIGRAFASAAQKSPINDSPLSSRSSTPPSKASSGDEVASVASDLSDISLSSSRRDSSSDDEKEKTKNSPESPKLRLSSSAMVGSLLPPSPVTQPRSPLKADLRKEPSVDHSLKVSQVPSIAISKASVPHEKEKSLLAKLGFNRNKSAPSSQAPVVGSGAGVTYVATPQPRNGLLSNSSVR